MRRNAQHRRRKRQNKKWMFSGRSISNSPPSRPIRVLIADKHEVVRAGLRAFLQGEEDIDVVGEADNTDGVFSESRRTKPEVVLLESELSGGSQFDICKRLFEALPSVRIVSLMRDNNDRAFLDAIEAGAQGYLQKNACRIELVRAVRTVAKGGSYLGPEGTEQTFRLLRQQQDGVHSRSRLHALSLQEQRVISLIAEGNTNKEIATKLVLSDKTVKNYIANLFVKLAVERRAQAVAVYLKAQVLPGQDPFLQSPLGRSI